MSFPDSLDIGVGLSGNWCISVIPPQFLHNISPYPVDSQCEYTIIVTECGQWKKINVKK